MDEQGQSNYRLLLPPQSHCVSGRADQEWLDAVNAERKKLQLDSVSYEFFEIVMDRLEKEWFDLVCMHILSPE